MADAVKWAIRNFVVPAWAKGALPQVDGEARVRGLAAPAQVHRDAYGVPHIEAASLPDAMRCLGFCIAQDRLWQIYAMRLLATGRLSAALGEGAIPVDTFALKIGWKRLAEGDWAAYREAAAAAGARTGGGGEDEVSPGDVLDALVGYAEGINEGVAALASMPFEFKLLGVEWEPWEPVHTLCIVRLMCFTMSFGWQGPLIRQWLRQAVGDRAADEWTEPSSSAEGTDFLGYCTVPQSGSALPEDLFRTALPFLDDALGGGSAADSPLRRVARQMGAAVGLSPGGPERNGNGSNFYAVGSAHTSTGSAVMVADPHLSVELPHIWYEAHLRCATGYHVTGVTVPGIPAVMLGHNEHLAMGITLSYCDMEDVFVEKVVRRGAGGFAYEHAGEVKEAEHHVEQLRVKGRRDPVEVHVYRTVHGAVMSGMDEQDAHLMAARPFAAEDEAPSRALAFATSTRVERSRMLQAVLNIGACADFASYRRNVRDIECIGLNLGYADRDGNVGYAMCGNVPLRSTARGEERLPLCGWSGEKDWRGFLRKDAMPSALNPVQADGSTFVVSANSAIVDYRCYEHYLGQLFLPGFRYEAIREQLTGMLRGGARRSLEELAACQLSYRDILAEEFVAFFRGIGPPVDASARLAYDVLVAWDGDMGAASAGAAVYNTLKIALRREMLEKGLQSASGAEEDLPEDAHRMLLGAGFFKKMRIMNPIKQNFHNVLKMLRRGDASYWTRSAGGAAVLCEKALREAALLLQRHCGEDPASWTFGAVHRATFCHVFTEKLGAAKGTFLDGPTIPLGGSGETPNQVGVDYAVDEGGSCPHPVAGALASARLLFDCGDWDRCRTVLPTGQSGNYKSRNYLDQMQLWRDHQTKPAPWSPAAVKALTVHTLVLSATAPRRPSGGAAGLLLPALAALVAIYLALSLSS